MGYLWKDKYVARLMSCIKPFITLGTVRNKILQLCNTKNYMLNKNIQKEQYNDTCIRYHWVWPAFAFRVALINFMAQHKQGG